MNTFKLIPSKRILVLNVPRIFSVKHEIIMLFPPKLLSFYSKTTIIIHAFLAPFFIELSCLVWMHEILHFHLFKFPLAEEKLARAYLVAEHFSYLRDAERNAIETHEIGRA